MGALSRSLIHFKEYDMVLTQVYKFCGPAFNFEFVRDVLTGLDNIVNVGEMEAEEKQKLNQVAFLFLLLKQNFVQSSLCWNLMMKSTVFSQYALSFDLGCVDSIRNVLQAMKQTSSDDLAAWRQTNRHPDENSVEVSFSCSVSHFFNSNLRRFVIETTGQD